MRYDDSLYLGLAYVLHVYVCSPYMCMCVRVYNVHCTCVRVYLRYDDSLYLELASKKAISSLGPRDKDTATLTSWISFDC